jgi:hypothetical protein
VSYKSYWTFYAHPYTTKKPPSINFVEVGMRDKNIFYLTNAAAKSIPKDYYIWFEKTYTAEGTESDWKTLTNVTRNCNTKYFTESVVRYTQLADRLITLNVVYKRNSTAITETGDVTLLTLTGKFLWASSQGVQTTVECATAIVCGTYSG